MGRNCSHRYRTGWSTDRLGTQERKKKKKGRGLTCPRVRRRRVGAGSVNDPLIFRRLTFEARGEGVFSEAKVRRAGV
jgi:hypothetical protein